MRQRGIGGGTAGGSAGGGGAPAPSLAALADAAGLPDPNGPGAAAEDDGAGEDGTEAPGLAASVLAEAVAESDTAVAAVRAIGRRAAPACVGVATE
ncbi:hypothetical protein [Lysobacter enzymogenes]|uniref:hypothetical protein n=1 Tax=Lysobacter enzymogenes TaxID=69 RepID=UPI001A95F5E2|nr:hypothetical protein [Lysobacter enzymogenes]QQP94916.1 hypothetical protein JHW38_16895 [Lysobacter enzymogenes]